jgi:cAMP-dependent protein kinase regulator
MNRSVGKYSIPDQLRDVLLEFTIGYLLEQPSDLIDFGVDFFTKLRENRSTTIIKVNSAEGGSPEESVVSGDEEGKFLKFNKHKHPCFFFEEIFKQA